MKMTKENDERIGNCFMYAFPIYRVLNHDDFVCYKPPMLIRKPHIEGMQEFLNGEMLNYEEVINAISTPYYTTITEELKGEGDMGRFLHKVDFEPEGCDVFYY